MVAPSRCRPTPPPTAVPAAVVLVAATLITVSVTCHLGLRAMYDYYSLLDDVELGQTRNT